MQKRQTRLPTAVESKNVSSFTGAIPDTTANPLALEVQCMVVKVLNATYAVWRATETL